MEAVLKKIISVLLCLSVAISLVVMSGVTSSAESRSGNFNKNYKLTGNGAQDICTVAKAQIGKTESSLGYSSAWCACFVSDCAKLAGVSDAIPFSNDCTSLKSAVLNAGGKIVSSPQAGDIAFYICTYCGMTHAAVVTGSDASVHGNYNSEVTGEISLTRFSDSSRHSARNGTVRVECIRPNYAKKLNSSVTVEEENIKKPSVSGDFDGDGDTDVAQFVEYNGGVAIDIFRSNGNTFTRRGAVWNSGKGWSIDKIKRHIASGDFNGDGKDDICAFYDYGKGETRAFVWLSNGIGFNLCWNWWYTSTGFNSNKIVDRVVSGDFNGDGKDDI